MGIHVLNTLEIGMNSINIFKKNLDIRGVIGLSKRNAADKISGYRYQKSFCQKNDLEFIEVESYALSNPNDKKKLLNLNIDILIVSGWQRLVPSWLIEHCKVCVIGSHGSVHGITGGRGRSPQNWALMLGKEKFDISIFKIDGGIDSGPIIDTRTFVISDLDDIKTTYYKVSWLTAEMIIDHIKNGKMFSDRFVKQKGKARYLPQRLPEDGEMDWSRTSKEIYDFIRALTKPYPGAFSSIGKGQMTIWKGRPFEIKNNTGDFKFGEIVNKYHNGDLLIKTGDSFFLIEEYVLRFKECAGRLKEGDVLSSGNFHKQSVEIINRHKRKYPDLLLSDDILRLVSRK